LRTAGRFYRPEVFADFNTQDTPRPIAGGEKQVICERRVPADIKLSWDQFGARSKPALLVKLAAGRQELLRHNTQYFSLTDKRSAVVKPAIKSDGQADDRMNADLNAGSGQRLERVTRSDRLALIEKTNHRRCTRKSTIQGKE